MLLKGISTIGLLICSNVFMTLAWYGHIAFKSSLQRYGIIAIILFSWGIALFEYCFQVPANRIGHTMFSLAQLKILQEVITLSVFVPFAIFYMGEKLSWNYLCAGLCMIGAVFFIFR